MTITLDGNTLPIYNGITIAKDDAIATNRGQDGSFNADRSYKKNRYTLSYDLLEIEVYNTIALLYETQFATGQFFQFQITGTGYPINTMVYIAPSSIKPKFAGKLLDNYDLVLIEK